MSSPIQTNQMPLSVFIRQGFFSIPQFQREYRWPWQTIWKLLQDIWNAFKQEKPVKIIGMVITFKRSLDSDGETHQIVDGQQRLVTLLVFFRALIIWIQRHESSQPAWLAAFSNLLSELDVNDGVMRSRLKLNCEEESEWMEKYIFCTGGNVTESDILDKAESHAATRVANIQRCLKTCLSFLSYRLGVNRNVEFHGDNRLHMYKEKQKDSNLTKDQKSFNNLGELEDFKKFLLLKTSLAHCQCTDSSIAIEQFCCMNATGLPLTQSQMLKAHLMNQPESSEHLEDFASSWGRAETSLIDVSWAGLRYNAVSLFGIASGEEDFILPYLQLMAETMPIPSELTDRGWSRFENGEDQGKFEGVSVSLGLLEHFMQLFAAPSPSGKGQRHKLFQRKTAFPNRVAFKWMFDNYFRTNDHAVLLYRSFIDMRDTSWGEGPFLGTDCPAKDRIAVQNCISLLKHLGHSGLDQNFIAPAWLFSWKYSLTRGTLSCSAQQARVFFERLERLASYINFVLPRFAKDDRARMSKEFRNEPRRSLARGVDHHVEATRAQQHFYRKLQEQIWNEPLSKVLEWLELGPRELKLFTNVLSEFETFRFPHPGEPFLRRSEGGAAAGQESFWRRQVRYVLVKAEFSHAEYETNPVQLHIAMTDKLPNGLSVSPDGAFIQAYRQLTLEHILPKSCPGSSDWMDDKECKWTHEDRDKWLDKLGNLTLLTQADNKRAGSETWLEKRKIFKSDYQHQLSITTQICDFNKFSPESCKQRHSTLLRQLEIGWQLEEGSLSLSIDSATAASTASAFTAIDSPVHLSPRHACKPEVEQQFRKFYEYDDVHDQTRPLKKPRIDKDRSWDWKDCQRWRNQEGWDTENFRSSDRSWDWQDSPRWRHQEGWDIASQYYPRGRYKTTPCHYFNSNRRCERGDKCTFAHGSNELRCLHFHCDSYCAFRKQCRKLHDIDELNKKDLVEVVKNLKREDGESAEWRDFCRGAGLWGIDPMKQELHSLKEFVEYYYFNKCK